MKNFLITIGLILTIKSSVSVNFFDPSLASYGLHDSFEIPTRTFPINFEYDFIVVGSGSSGSAVASRLSENRNWNILLLEAGRPEDVLNQIPIETSLVEPRDYSWGYQIEPDKNSCLGMNGKRCIWPRGKSLGGTSTINNMIHTRGNKLDFDEWEKIGNKGWSFDELLPYFKKSERFRIKGQFDPSYHNSDGNVCVENSKWRTPLATAFLEAGRSIGYDITDINGPYQFGFSYVQLNSDNGARHSAAKAYLQSYRPNFDIVYDAQVLKVLINSQKKAYGVQYEKNGVILEVYSSKEVILSAGPIESPKLLMLSGIGPEEHLNQFNIPVVKDAKVGYNLQEHIGFWGLSFLVDSPTTLQLKRLLDVKVISDYTWNREGPLSSPGGVESIAFLRTKYAKDMRPDVELLLIAAGLNFDDGLLVRKLYGISDEVYNAVYKPIEGKDTFTIWPILQHPKSTGRVTLRSRNPKDNPIIRGNFFHDPMDIEIIVEGIKYAMKLTETESFQKYKTKINDLPVPGCGNITFGSDDYWKCAIRQIPAMQNDAAGTAKMGPKNDSTAVVDSQLRVYGVNGLRVIDSSIFPTITGAHITANLYMLGEKGAAMIREKWSS